MKLHKLFTSLIAGASVCASALAYSSPAAADPESGYAARKYTDSSSELVPNTDLIASGIFTFAIPYLASVAVATGSTRKGDNFLYTPVAGPWMNLSNRDNCPPVGTCANETAYRMLLVADGVLQGFGALEFVSGFLFPVPKESTTRVHVAPSVSPQHAGVTAYGQF
jgi:hypothetical protein